MNRTKTLLLSILVMLSINVLHAESYVVVEKVDGTQAEYQLSDLPRISYDGSVVKIATTQVTVEMPVAVVRKACLKTDDDTGIRQFAVATPRFAITSDGLCVSGLQPGNTVSSASVDGRITATTTASADGTARLDITGRGIIIIKSNNQSFKIIRK